MTDHSRRKDLESFFGVLEDATQTFNIWQACQQSHGNKVTVEMFNEVYPGLLVWIEHALLAQTINSLCFVNEKRKDTFNFVSLLSRFRDSLSEASHVELSLKIDALKPVWIKLSILRNEIFAHRTNLRAISDSFLKASISTAEIESYIKDARFIVQRMGILCFGVTYHFRTGCNATMTKLIQDLRAKNSFAVDASGVV